MVDYLEDFPTFGANHGLPEYDILDLVGFALPYECQNQLLV